MTEQERIEWLRPLWDRWLREAAESGDTTAAELQARLDSGEAALQISFTVPSDKPRWVCPAKEAEL